MHGSATGRERVGPFVYVRFHGASGHYGGGYSATRGCAAGPTGSTAQRAAGCDVYAYFNNDIGGHAPRNAVTLRRMMEETAMNNEQKFPCRRGRCGAAAGLAERALSRARRAIDFAGRVVVITGGSRGLGLVLARQLAAEGAHLCLLARDDGELERARAELEPDRAGEVMTLTLRRPPARRRPRRRSTRSSSAGRAIDVLINNAGVIQVGPLEHMTTRGLRECDGDALLGAAAPDARVGCRRCARRGFGRIVNISSIGGRIAVPHLAPYCASKFALVGLSDAVRAELEQHGIRVTTVAPGLMRTGSPVNADVQGPARRGVRVVRESRLAARAVDRRPSARPARSSTPAATAIRS